MTKLYVIGSPVAGYVKEKTADGLFMTKDIKEALRLPEDKAREIADKTISMMIEEVGDTEDIKCIHCGETSDPSNYPDLYYEGCSPDAEKEKVYNEQALIQERMNSLGFNIVTCGDCGGIILTDRKQKNITDIEKEYIERKRKGISYSQDQNMYDLGIKVGLEQAMKIKQKEN